MVGLRTFLLWVARSVRRIAVTIVGVLLLVAGVIMIITPGPGWLTIIAGLALLGTEYTWARRTLEAAKRRAMRTRDRVSKRQRRSPGTPEERPGSTRPSRTRPGEGPRSGH